MTTAAKIAIILLVASATLALAVAQGSRSAGKWSELEISFATDKITAYDYILDLGVVGSLPDQTSASFVATSSCWGEPAMPIDADSLRKTLELSIRNKGKRPLRLSPEVVGGKVTASWTKGVGQDRTLQLGPEKGDTLRISFAPGQAKEQDFNAVLLMNEVDPVAVISIDYLLLPNLLPITLSSGSVPNGDGNAYSLTTLDGIGYKVASGPAPPHYMLRHACHWLTGDRVCGSYSHCDWIGQPSREGAAFHFTLQGHNESTPHTRYSEGHLGLLYEVIEDTPRLKTPDAQAEAPAFEEVGMPRTNGSYTTNGAWESSNNKTFRSWCCATPSVQPKRNGPSPSAEYVGSSMQMVTT